jgi:hypothetical protein
MGGSGRKPAGPGWGEIAFAAALSILLGVILGAAVLVLQPVVVVKELPPERDRPRGVVYHVEGRHDSSKQAEAVRKRQLFMGGQSISLGEEELNLLFAPAKPAAAGKKESKAEVVIAGAFAVGEPNVRLADGLIQLAAPVRLTLPDLGLRVIVQVRGRMVRKPEGFVFDPAEIRVGSCPVGGLPFVLGLVRSRLGTLDVIPEDLRANWLKLADASVEGGLLRLRLP